MSVRTYPNIRSRSAVQMKGLKTIQEDQMVEKWGFWSNQHPKCPPLDPWRPPVGDIKHLKLIGEAFENLYHHWNWSAVQMKRPFGTTIRDDQMAKKWDFWSNRPPKCPFWPLPTPCEPLKVSRTPSEGLWEPIPTLEAGQQSKWRGLWPFRRKYACRCSKFWHFFRENKVFWSLPVTGNESFFFKIIPGNQSSICKKPHVNILRHSRYIMVRRRLGSVFLSFCQ